MDTDQLRAEFEAWCETRHMETGRDDEGVYISLETDLSWEAYQAGRAALQPAEPVKVPSDAKEALWEAYSALRELEKEIVLDVNQISGAAAANFAANRVLALLERYGRT